MDLKNRTDPVFPTLHTERFTLRQFEASDLENVYKGLSDPNVIKYYGVSFDSHESTREQIKWFKDLEESGKGIWWAICKTSSMEFMGGIGFNDLDSRHKKVELGFWLYPDFWGKGVISEVVPEVTNYGFQELGLHRIEAYVESENRNSFRVLEKNGFTYEGTMKECEVKNGTYIDIAIFAMLSA